MSTMAKLPAVLDSSLALKFIPIIELKDDISNFNEWEHSVRFYLDYHGLYGYLDPKFEVRHDQIRKNSPARKASRSDPFGSLLEPSDLNSDYSARKPPSNSHGWGCDSPARKPASNNGGWGCDSPAEKSPSIHVHRDSLLVYSVIWESAKAVLPLLSKELSDEVYGNHQHDPKLLLEALHDHRSLQQPQVLKDNKKGKKVSARDWETFYGY